MLSTITKIMIYLYELSVSISSRNFHKLIVIPLLPLLVTLEFSLGPENTTPCSYRPSTTLDFLGGGDAVGAAASLSTVGTHPMPT